MGLKKTLLLVLLLALGTEALGGSDITTEKTLISNGVYAAGYADTSLQGGGETRYGIAFGWQLVKGWGNALTLGYMINSRTDAKGLLRGPEAQWILAPEGWYVYGGVAVTPLTGYLAYSNPPENTNKFVDVTGRRIEGKLALRIFPTTHLLLLAGSNQIEVDESIPATSIVDHGDSYFGVGLRFTQM